MRRVNPHRVYLFTQHGVDRFVRRRPEVLDDPVKLIGDGEARRSLEQGPIILKGNLRIDCP